MNVLQLATHRDGSTQIVPVESPKVHTVGIKHSLSYEDFLTLDPQAGASRVWFRLQPGNGPWRLLLAGQKIQTKGLSTSIELLPDYFEQEQSVRIVTWSETEDFDSWLLRDNGESVYDQQTFVNMTSLVNAGVGRTKPGSFINSTLDYTTRYVTVDGRQGAAVVWVYDGETIQLAAHGQSVRLRIADSSAFVGVAPCVQDLTSIVCLVPSNKPLSIPPITSRTIVHTTAQSSGTTNNNWIIDYRLPSKTNAGVGIVEYYISGAGNLIRDAVYDGNSGVAPTFVNISTAAVGAGHGYITTGLARSQKVSFRTNSAVNLTVTCKDMGTP